MKLKWVENTVAGCFMAAAAIAIVSTTQVGQLNGNSPTFTKLAPLQSEEDDVLQELPDLDSNVNEEEATEVSEVAEVASADLVAEVPDIPDVADVSFHDQETNETTDEVRETEIREDVHHLVRDWHSASSEEKAQKREQLKTALTEVFRQRIQAQRNQLEKMKDKIAAIENQIDRRAELEDQIVERHLGAMLGEADILSWDHVPGAQSGLDVLRMPFSGNFQGFDRFRWLNSDNRNSTMRNREFADAESAQRAAQAELRARQVRDQWTEAKKHAEETEASGRHEQARRAFAERDSAERTSKYSDIFKDAKRYEERVDRSHTLRDRNSDIEASRNDMRNRILDLKAKQELYERQMQNMKAAEKALEREMQEEELKTPRGR